MDALCDNPLERPMDGHKIHICKYFSLNTVKPYKEYYATGIALESR